MCKLLLNLAAKFPFSFYSQSMLHKHISGLPCTCVLHGINDSDESDESERDGCSFGKYTIARLDWWTGLELRAIYSFSRVSYHQPVHVVPWYTLWYIKHAHE